MQSAILSDLVVSLDMTAGILKDLITSMSAEDLKEKRRPGFWSIQHHIYHLAETQELLYKRLVRFKEEESPAFTPFFPSDEKERKDFSSSEEALSAFMDLRKKQIELINSFSDADLRKEGTHPEYRRYNILILVRHLLMHDHWHMYRMEELWLTTEEYLSAE